MAAKTVLITGANRGIGLSFAEQYTQQGWKVIATARNVENAAKVPHYVTVYACGCAHGW